MTLNTYPKENIMAFIGITLFIAAAIVIGRWLVNFSSVNEEIGALQSQNLKEINANQRLMNVPSF